MTKICGAKTRKGTPCQRPPVPGRTRCKLHGGATLRGEESGTFKHGRYSKYMPQRLKQQYEDALENDETNILRDNMQLRDAIISERLQTLEDAPDSATVWKELRKQLDIIERAYKDEQYGDLDVAIATLRTLSDERLIYLETLKELKDDLAEQRKDRVAISQIEYKGEQAITPQQLMTLMGAVVHLITETVSSKDERIRLADGLDNLITIPSPAEVVASAP